MEYKKWQCFLTPIGNPYILIWENEDDNSFNVFFPFWWQKNGTAWTLKTLNDKVLPVIISFDKEGKLSGSEIIEKLSPYIMW